MKRSFCAVVMVLIASRASGQKLATPTGHDVDVSAAHYDYVEPGAHSISIHGPKIGAGYTGTLPLSSRRHWFARADVRGTIGSATYDGWCSPWRSGRTASRRMVTSWISATPRRAARPVEGGRG